MSTWESFADRQKRAPIAAIPHKRHDSQKQPSTIAARHCILRNPNSDKMCAQGSFVLGPLIPFEPLIYFTTRQPAPRVCRGLGEPTMEGGGVAGAASLKLVQYPQGTMHLETPCLGHRP